MTSSSRRPAPRLCRGGAASAANTHARRELVRVRPPPFRLLATLREDLELFRGSASGNKLVFPGHDVEVWSLPAYQSWRRRSFRRAVQAAGIEHTTPYAQRDLLARQLGHDARLTLSRYGHVIDELDDQPRVSAETAIEAARG